MSLSGNEIKTEFQEDTEILPVNFIQNIIADDLKEGKNNGRVHTRFPPEPNGYLHIGHAKSICLNFGLAAANGGKCNLRFDDTNPSKEEVEFVESIQADIKWLGFDWEERLFYASDYFNDLYLYAVELIKAGKAYVCHLNAQEMKEYRGTLTEPGQDSPYRNRSISENLELFELMKKGEFPDGACVLRAKIDMASPNLNMRDPVLYRILSAHHHRTGNEWCIYPMYDYAHPLSDAFENITHSICTLEFADHRPLYDWILEALPLESYPRRVLGKPVQIEFARLNLSYTMMSKRKLRTLVEEDLVEGWDDPRMPTISGLRRRGYTPEAIRDFCERIGVAKRDSMVDFALLEHCVREDLNARSTRIMAVLKPLKVVIKNYPEGQVEWLETDNNPENLEMGSRKIPFSRVIYIEDEDFMEDPPKKFFRLKPEGEIRLKSAYIIKCTEVIKDDKGQIIEIHCTYDPESKSGGATAGRKVKGTCHWVSADHAVNATVRLYQNLFQSEAPDENDGDIYANINPNSRVEIENCKIEPSVAEVEPGSRYQFLRQGYFYLDPIGYDQGKLTFTRIVSLKDSWAKIQNKL
jgi:glutaminyl-tRNA synthetase